MYIKRTLASHLLTLKEKFPVLGILGPRQSGKTTLAKQLFRDYKYFNLEELDVRAFTKEDPRRFLKSIENEKGVILDEIQKSPDLLSYIQAYVDETKKAGFFVLTGSENILLNHHINQTLAGRIALTTLLPLSLSEISQQNSLNNIDQMIFKGFYPSIISENNSPEHWIQSYIHAYVERDVRNLKQITDLFLFQKFLKLCAGRIGQILDLTSLGNDCGISANTVKSWLSILESTYLIFLVYPHHKNFSKRLIKSPKIFFYDTAIACQLLSIETPKQLQTHYLRGNLFESLILSDIIKEKCNRGKTPNLYFWRDKMGLEIDGILEKGSSITAIEIKSSETISTDFFSNLVKWNNLPENTDYTNYVVYAGSEEQERSQGTILSWNNLSKLYNHLFNT